ncbi:hypothetical protein ACFWP7_22395 [Streptomyces sp. NPDC058470]|uniref:hypothetical protein n=1 Tax=Streptomyces sp. NPDC058470 TaxID=3346515 RepID=UPI00364EC512
MRHMKPNFDYFTTNRDKAQAYAAQASWENISSRRRAEYLALARLYLDLSIQDAAGNSAPTEDAAKAKKAERDTARS